MKNTVKDYFTPGELAKLITKMKILKILLVLIAQNVIAEPYFL
jgi:hypothetical protein